MARTRRGHRVTLIVFVIAAAATCLALGWWQWDRYESASGTGQNLGYALQWPLFAAFCVYGYRRFVKLEDQQAEIVDAESTEGSDDSDAAATAPVGPRPEVPDSGPGRLGRLLGRDSAPAVTEIPADLLPQRGANPANTAGPAPAEHAASDQQLREYNEYLAQLDERSMKGRGR
ncbi:transcriptional regulator [Tomitella gaofuii]|uniref:transcriptional regulator n=1 Tax=Tomitella gaofuii TaxID=2760083 RepID=UPI0015FC4375|nr:transcriptional regulator [Tomitella gaofuii]